MADTHPQHRKDDQAERALLARTPDVIAPGHTYNTVTDVISHTVLSKRTPIGWSGEMALAPASSVAVPS